MKKVTVILSIIFLTCIGNSYGATRFFYEDFEDQNFRDTFVSTAETYCNVWDTALTVTASDPYAGSYSLRYQATEGYSDPVENLTGSSNSRINIGQLTPVNGSCGAYTDLRSHFTDEFAVVFKIKFDADFDWYNNCKKILRIKEFSVFGANGMMTWAQYETYANAYQGDEFWRTDDGSVDIRYRSYTPPRNEWITIIVYMNFVNDTILFRAIDSNGTHDVYNGPYYSTANGGSIGYQGARPDYITLVGAQCGAGTGGNRGLQVDDVEIWDGMPNTTLDAPILTATSPADDTATLQWTEVGGDGVEGYYVYYDTNSGEPYTGNDASQGTSPIDVPISSIDDPSNPELILTGLSATDNYYFTVSAYTSDGSESAYSNEEVKTSVVDTTPPVITMLGNTPIDHPSGTVYLDAGATASDNIDGNITAQIITVNPVNINVPGTYTITYNVDDAAGNSANEVTRTVNVIFVNTAPVANSNSYATDEDIALTGTLSAYDADSDTLTYSIVENSGLGIVTIINQSDGSFTYTPSTNVHGADFFTFMVNDGTDDSNIATVTISVNEINDPPIADAGPNQSTNQGNTVTLNGSASFDIDDGIDTFQWFQTDGIQVTLSNQTSDRPTFTAPTGNTADEYLIFQLTVEDTGNLTDTDTVTVTVSGIVIVDRDGDGVLDDDDDFPDNPNEWLDTDNDGIGNNTDDDDDNDGMPDDWEALYDGLDPLLDDANGDLDRDDITNIDEYYYETDPTQPDGNLPPDRPVLYAPADNVDDVQLTPELQTEMFSDPDADDTHATTKWQISTEPDFSSLVLSRASDTHLTSAIVPELVMNQGIRYYWRVSFYDNHNTASQWSSPFSLTTLLDDTYDINLNGIPDNQEVDNTVDLDADGTPDMLQEDILCVNTAAGDAQMGVKGLINVVAIEAMKAYSPDMIKDIKNKPQKIPFGYVSFKIEVANPGDIATVVVYMSKAAPLKSNWYKYDSMSGWQVYSEHATFSGDRKSITIELQDGGFGDADGVENGVIVDPGGIGETETSDDGTSLSDSSDAAGGCFIDTIETSNHADPIRYFFGLALSLMMLCIRMGIKHRLLSNPVRS